MFRANSSNDEEEEGKNFHAFPINIIWIQMWVSSQTWSQVRHAQLLQLMVTKNSLSKCNNNRLGIS